MAKWRFDSLGFKFYRAIKSHNKPLEYGRSNQKLILVNVMFVIQRSPRKPSRSYSRPPTELRDRLDGNLFVHQLVGRLLLQKRLTRQFEQLDDWLAIERLVDDSIGAHVEDLENGHQVLHHLGPVQEEMADGETLQE